MLCEALNLTLTMSTAVEVDETSVLSTLTKFRSQIFLMVVFGAVVSTSQSHSSSHQSAVNSPNERDDRLLRPIVIPNLTGFSEDFFTSKSRYDGKDDGKLPEVFREKASEVTDRDRESSQNSVVRVPETKETPKSKENVSKFSSRYSSRPEVYRATSQDTTERMHTRGIKEEEEQSEKVTEGLEVASLLDTAENESDILPENTVYPGNPENAPFSGREKEKEEPKSYTDDQTDTKEMEREPEIMPTNSEPHLELRISPSVDNLSKRYSDEEEEEEENREAAQHDDIATKEHEEEKKRHADDPGDPKNYHSIQTPLHKIKFMGSHDFKDDSESSRMRTRPINPIERDHARYEWPYFKTQVKAEAEKDNEIATDGNESHDKDREDSEEWENDKTSSKVSELDRAVEKDEARYGPALKSNEKYNLIREKNRHLENQKALIAEEEKDHGRPLFKMLSHNSENQSELNFGDKTHKQENERWRSRLASTQSSPKLLKNEVKSSNLESTDVNIPKELEPDFQGLKFLSSAIFNKNTQQKQAKNSELSKELSKNIFIQELENKEMIDQKNLHERKNKELTGDEITSQSFNHLEESDEMYNQILANIQSVFGLRTQPLKSSVRRKSNNDPELKQEENKSLTWSTTLPRRTRVDHKGLENSPGTGTEKKVKRRIE